MNWTHTSFLPDGTADAIALAGLVFGIATVIALVIGVAQIRKTKRAALAARQATDRAVAYTKGRVVAHSATHARYFLAQANSYVAGENWMMAAMRVSDAADRFADLQNSLTGDHCNLAEPIEVLRTWQHTFFGLHSGKHKWTKPLVTKWSESALNCAKSLDGFAALDLSVQGGDHEPE